MRTGFAVLLLVITAAARAADPAAWMGVKNATAELVDEPVFDGEAMLYRAGPRGGEPVVLVHGLGPNGARDWAGIVPALARRHEVFALDLPGFGASSKGNELYSPETYARVIDKVVAPRVGRPFALVGHSMGGAVALAYAAAYPQRLSRLVLVDMAGVLHGSVYAASLARLGFTEVTGLDPDGAPWFDGLLRDVILRVENLPVDRELLLRAPALRERLFRGDPNVIAAYALGQHDFSEALRSVTAPTLVIWGTEDRVAPLRTGWVAASTIPGARLQLITGAGHSPQIEEPEKFAAILLDELAGRSNVPPFALARTGPLAGRATSCDGKANARFTGDLPKLTLIRCAGVEISGARIGELRVLESDVRIVNSEIRGGLYALRSRVEVTGGKLAGAPALTLDNSDADIAGTVLETPDALVANVGAAPLDLRLSVAEIRRAGKATRYVHDVVRLEPKGRW